MKRVTKKPIKRTAKKPVERVAKKPAEKVEEKKAKKKTAKKHRWLEEIEKAHLKALYKALRRNKDSLEKVAEIEKMSQAQISKLVADNKEKVYRVLRVVYYLRNRSNHMENIVKEYSEMLLERDILDRETDQSYGLDSILDEIDPTQDGEVIKV